jgi:hypothetical protein
MRKARADLFNSHIYREIACCYEGLAADSDESSNSYFARGSAADWAAPETNSRAPLNKGLSAGASEPVAAHLGEAIPRRNFEARDH